MKAAALVAVVCAAVLAGGCGIPSDDRPETLPGGPVSWPAAVGTPGAGAGTDAAPNPIFLVRAGVPVPVSRTGRPPGLTRAIELLLAGPTEEELAAGLRTAVAPGTRLRSVQLAQRTAVLDLTSGFVEVGGAEQILAVAQVVLTATAHPDVERVSIALDGHVVEVPLADGTLAAGPLTAEHYAPLLARDGG